MRIDAPRTPAARAPSGGVELPPIDPRDVPIAAPRDLTAPEDLFAEAERFYPYGSESFSDRMRAAQLYRAFAESFPSHPQAPEALLRAHEVLDAMNRIEEEVQVLETFRARYPHHGEMAYVLYGLGYLYRMMGEREKGRERYEELLERFPESNYAAQARVELKAERSAAKGSGPEWGGLETP